jgi:hypothetical protein
MLGPWNLNQGHCSESNPISGPSDMRHVDRGLKNGIENRLEAGVSEKSRHNIERDAFAQDMTDSEAKLMQQYVVYWKGLMDRGLVIVFGPVADPID